jgi:hypothetical protein
VVGRSIAGQQGFWIEKPAQQCEDAIFRLASFTKPLVAAAALAMIERGLLSLDQTVAATLHSFARCWTMGGFPILPSAICCRILAAAALPSMPLVSAVA